ncbi:hypothetical protein PRIPAC_78029 [Pristionchus pacificus]|uniref:Uncharacterized protein n=1 Tax=Pristionchus pacificus TaxID=54126 RepID=A0A2A6BXC5_PRIPA|nr:hypothetical protein PRIPAC_78029 [Pristionchus pacificus]|eukprot:PDM70516.1 hypothetical protein PRIPAC_46762 [Pristionchus pacificus]
MSQRSEPHCFLEARRSDPRCSLQIRVNYANARKANFAPKSRHERTAISRSIQITEWGERSLLPPKLCSSIHAK